MRVLVAVFASECWHSAAAAAALRPQTRLRPTHTPPRSAAPPLLLVCVQGTRAQAEAAAEGARALAAEPGVELTQVHATTLAELLALVGRPAAGGGAGLQSSGGWVGAWGASAGWLTAAWWYSLDAAAAAVAAAAVVWGLPASLLSAARFAVQSVCIRVRVLHACLRSHAAAQPTPRAPSLLPPPNERQSRAC